MEDKIPFSTIYDRWIGSTQVLILWISIANDVKSKYCIQWFRFQILDENLININRVLVKRLPVFGESTPKAVGRCANHFLTIHQPFGSWSSNSAWEMGVGRIILDALFLIWAAAQVGVAGPKTQLRMGVNPQKIATTRQSQAATSELLSLYQCWIIRYSQRFS
jgi:hypothetical protein